MPETGAWLIGFAILSFSAAFAAGFVFYRSRIWDWADPMYYVIGVAGVVLLYMSNEQTRVLTDLRAELIVAEQQLSRLEVRNPPDLQKQKAEKQAYIGQIQAQINTINQQEGKSSIENFVDFVVGHFWPFVLIFALAIKFAKGIAALRR